MDSVAQLTGPFSFALQYTTKVHKLNAKLRKLFPGSKVFWRTCPPVGYPDDPEEARTTRLRILKSRYTGDVGMACRVVYDGETGRLSELTDEDITFDNSLDEAF